MPVQTVPPLDEDELDELLELDDELELLLELDELDELDEDELLDEPVASHAPRSLQALVQAQPTPGS
jgi:hypothetical protein